ncbi:NUDIX hydrolase [Leptothoe kymatousa]|uniref:NUDIX hydrolase n=1 Tax=Leptothoe kymatousa TAU-MAC 1615 TaxID=2364775 RepID=A0ABS5Y0H8_9CYAN|nr:NUDIX hydrolase [Leptothoe kymatousa]MBT9310964.1 NUDIX hydrolase [Leptothoe kymatousa TAU-MAC 1615]
MPTPQLWKILSSRLAFDHRWYKVRQDTVCLPNGKVIDDYFVSVRPDVALVLPLTAHGDIVMIRQYRHGAQAILLELPAGTFDPSQEDPQIAAKRELEEETGYTAPTLKFLSVLYDNPVKETNRIHLFLAENAYLVGEQRLDETEDIEVVLLSIDDIHQYIAAGYIQVAGTLAALYLGLQHWSNPS